MACRATRRKQHRHLHICFAHSHSHSNPRSRTRARTRMQAHTHEQQQAHAYQAHCSGQNLAAEHIKAGCRHRVHPSVQASVKGSQSAYMCSPAACATAAMMWCTFFALSLSPSCSPAWYVLAHSRGACSLLMKLQRYAASNRNQSLNAAQQQKDCLARAMKAQRQHEGCPDTCQHNLGHA